MTNLHKFTVVLTDAEVAMVIERYEQIWVKTTRDQRRIEEIDIALGQALVACVVNDLRLLSEVALCVNTG